jgi:hypothetical protein
MITVCERWNMFRTRPTALKYTPAQACHSKWTRTTNYLRHPMHGHGISNALDNNTIFIVLVKMIWQFLANIYHILGNK